jgi:RNA polymerase sigma-70 factor, ECF subfamily
MASDAVGKDAGAGGPVLTDAEVVQRVKAGEGALFELLMRRYNQRLYRVARSIVKDDAEAEDVMQQAYVNAYTHLAQFAERAQFSTWLTRIAVHEALGRARRRGRLTGIDALSGRQEGQAVLTSKDPSPEQETLTGELRAALETALDSIPEMYRTAFVLREVEGLSTAEAAQCLETSEDVVKTRLHRARALLQQELLARAGTGASGAFTFHARRCDRVVEAVFTALGLRATLRA